jgi:hypothetical protein
MDVSDLAINDKSKTLVRGLLEKAQPIPKDSLFRDDLFNSTFRKIRNRNETRVIQEAPRSLTFRGYTPPSYRGAAEGLPC